MKNCSLARAVVLAVLLSGLAFESEASILTFDDISSADIALIPDGYGGFDWDEMGYLNGGNRPGSGYDNGTVSGEHVAFNNFARVGTIEDGTFTFNGAYLTAAWNNGLSITVAGFLGAVQLYSETVVVNTTGPTWFDFDFIGVDRLTFDSFGGVDADGDLFNGAGEHFAMDNFTFNEVAGPVVPEASSFVVWAGIMGAVGVIVVRLGRLGRPALS